MRLIISLKPDRIPYLIPFQYPYYLTALIYSFLNTSSASYARFLHDEGYRLGTKRFKLFTFSQLMIPKRRITPQGLVCLSSSLTWQISSPIAEFVEHLAAGLLHQGQMRLGHQDLAIERVEVVAPPRFHPQMQMRCLSPLVLSLPHRREGKLTARYLRADDAQVSEAIRQNLLRKFVLVHGCQPASGDLDVVFDRQYLQRREGYRLVDYKGTKIKAIMAPFKVCGSPELIEIGYEAGFGEKNSMGFGMVEVVQNGSGTKPRTDSSEANSKA